jgi:TubC N-terminal docking domain
MNVSEIVTNLNIQGVQFWADEGKLNVRSPKGVITPEIQAELSAQKAEILDYIQQVSISESQISRSDDDGLELQAVGRLIGGFSQTITADYRVPIIDAREMAQQLTVTFRPLPNDYTNQTILEFRHELEHKLKDFGVNVLPWQEATTEFSYEINLPLTKYKHKINTRTVRTDISAVIDVERPRSLIHSAKQCVAENLYQLYSSFVFKGKTISIARIAKLIGWAEEHAAKYIQDPTNTQVVILTELDQEFVDPNLPYQRKIQIGLNTLLKTLSELVIGVSDSQISILNMNLSDSIFPRGDLSHFVLNSLIPKVFVPIMPLPLSRFEIATYNPSQSNYAKQLVTLSHHLAETSLFPPIAKLSQVIKRKSYRDIVNVLVNGRTGVSYGFVAFAEPPSYVGSPEISEAEWNSLSPVEGFSQDQLRQNAIGRRYVRIKINAKDAFKQIPDLWLVSSRSGSNKTNLCLDTDVIRIGLKEKLYLQLPPDSMTDQLDVKPSYDIYVMLGICLSAALYLPALIKDGAAIVHFHGYPASNWFKPNEYLVGVNNPSVPCGTYESGVFNFLGIADLANQDLPDLALACLLEPDHGTNVIAHNPKYLVDRLKAGCEEGEIELGGKHFASLKQSLSN